MALSYANVENERLMWSFWTFFMLSSWRRLASYNKLSLSIPEVRFFSDDKRELEFPLKERFIRELEAIIPLNAALLAVNPPMRLVIMIFRSDLFLHEHYSAN